MSDPSETWAMVVVFAIIFASMAWSDWLDRR